MGRSIVEIRSLIDIAKGNGRRGLTVLSRQAILAETVLRFGETAKAIETISLEPAPVEAGQ